MKFGPFHLQTILLIIVILFIIPAFANSLFTFFVHGTDPLRNWKVYYERQINDIFWLLLLERVLKPSVIL